MPSHQVSLLTREKREQEKVERPNLSSTQSCFNSCPIKDVPWGARRVFCQPNVRSHLNAGFFKVLCTIHRVYRFEHGSKLDIKIYFGWWRRVLPTSNVDGTSFDGDGVLAANYGYFERQHEILWNEWQSFPIQFETWWFWINMKIISLEIQLFQKQIWSFYMKNLWSSTRKDKFFLATFMHWMTLKYNTWFIVVSSAVRLHKRPLDRTG
ncbi:hypothetical protein YC2023_062183 [Brassica napus]